MEDFGDIAVESPEIDSQAEEPIEEQEEQGTKESDVVDGASTGGVEKKDDPYTTQFSREYRAAMRAWQQANPEQTKYAKQALDNHARLFALNQIEAKGIDGVRERYALLDALSHGEARGPEALTAIQESLAQTAEVDSLIQAGDPAAFDKLGPDFAQGLAKLAPAYLDRVMQTDREAYETAILPHVVGTIQQSPLLKEFNDLVDVLSSQRPDLDEPTKMQYVHQALSRMGQWLNGIYERSTKLAQPRPKEADTLQTERTQLEQERQEMHWKNNIAPPVMQHENSKFEELLKPFNTRLKLSPAAKQDLKRAFVSGLTDAGKKDAEYQRQMKIYRGQKNPDPTQVGNYLKNAINKHAKGVMEGIIETRYGSLLAKPRQQPVVRAAGTPARGPVEPNVEIRTVKPPMNEIDHRNTPPEWMFANYPGGKKYRLYSGKVVQVRAVQ